MAAALLTGCGCSSSRTRPSNAFAGEPVKSSSCVTATAARRAFIVRAAQPEPLEPSGGRRQALLAAGSVAAWAVVVGGAGPAWAIKTRRDPSPTVPEYEQYYFRPGGRLNVTQIFAQRVALKTLIQGEMMAQLPASAYPGAVRLAFLDAAPYDPYRNRPGYREATGGSNGSARWAAELERPEAVGLRDVVAALEPIKRTIDAKWRAHAAEVGTPGGPPPDALSWADAIAMAGVVAVHRSWGAAHHTWPVKQGRVDYPEADPAGRAPLAPGPVFDAALGAALPAEEVTAMRSWARHAGLGDARLAALYGELCGGRGPAAAALAVPAPDLAAHLTSLGGDAAEVAYRAEFMDAYNRLTQLGARFDPYAYLYDEPGRKPDPPPFFTPRKA